MVYEFGGKIRVNKYTLYVIKPLHRRVLTAPQQHEHSFDCNQGSLKRALQRGEGWEGEAQ